MSKIKKAFAVNLYTGRIGQSTSSPVMIEKRKDINEYLSLYHHENLELLGVNSLVKEGEFLVAATVHIPSFFEEFSKKAKTAYSGLFMAKISTALNKTLKKTNKNKGNSYAKDSSFWSFNQAECKGYGSYDCPHRIQLSPMNQDLSHLTFNGQAFFPLLMRNFTIVYNVADVSSQEYNWDHSKYTGPKESDFVAVDNPIEYDANLGLFVTRGARLIKV